jgi:uncharacterized protein YecE (DUF72 family)
VPADFRFAVKVPSAITHVRRLADCDVVRGRFLGEAASLGDKLVPLLVQLPPALAFEADVARRFFTFLRRRLGGGVVC